MRKTRGKAMLRREDRIALLRIAADAGTPEFLLVETAQRMEAYVTGKPLPAQHVEMRDTPLNEHRH